MLARELSGMAYDLRLTLLLLCKYQGIIIAGSSRPPTRECLPVATLDKTVISSAQNATVTKHLLGKHRNLSSCVLDCCKRDNCDLVMFDGNFCYGVLCSAEAVCHFQSAKEGQRPFNAVLLNNAFVGK